MLVYMPHLRRYSSGLGESRINHIIKRYNITGIDAVELILRMEPIGIEYLIDTGSLIELKKQKKWINYLNAKTEKHRRSDVRLT